MCLQRYWYVLKFSIVLSTFHMLHTNLNIKMSAYFFEKIYHVFKLKVWLISFYNLLFVQILLVHWNLHQNRHSQNRALNTADVSVLFPYTWEALLDLIKMLFNGYQCCNQWDPDNKKIPQSVVYDTQFQKFRPLLYISFIHHSSNKFYDR